jgi:hypothetical protein
MPVFAILARILGTEFVKSKQSCPTPLSKCCSYNNPEGIYSLHGKIGADVKGIVDASFSASGKVAITVKVGELLCQEIRDASFMSALLI